MMGLADLVTGIAIVAMALVVAIVVDALMGREWEGRDDG